MVGRSVGRERGGEEEEVGIVVVAVAPRGNVIPPPSLHFFIVQLTSGMRGEEFGFRTDVIRRLIGRSSPVDGVSGVI
jgi:hypothetical protein